MKQRGTYIAESLLAATVVALTSGACDKNESEVSPTVTPYNAVACLDNEHDAIDFDYEIVDNGGGVYSANATRIDGAKLKGNENLTNVEVTDPQKYSFQLHAYDSNMKLERIIDLPQEGFVIAETEGDEGPSPTPRNLQNQLMYAGTIKYIDIQVSKPYEKVFMPLNVTFNNKPVNNNRLTIEDYVCK